MKSEIPETTSVDEFADFIGVTPRTIRNLVSDGICTSAGRGKIALKPSVKGLLEYARRSADRDAEAAGRAALNDIRRRREEARFSILSGEFIPVAEAQAILDEVVATLRLALDTMPARIAGDDFALRRKIEQTRDAALQDASEKLAKLSQR